MNYESIRAEIYQQGFKRTHETKKLEEFESSGGQVIYLYKDQAMKDGVQILVHPGLEAAAFAAIPDVAPDAKFPLRSGSNMRRYPKRRSEKAVSFISYGRSMRVETLDGLRRLLVLISQVPVTA